MNLKFVVLNGKDEGTEFPLSEGATLGRVNCNISLDDPKISHHHGKVERSEGDLWLIDLGSTNGLKLKGRKVPRVLLKPGVVVQVGRTRLKVEPAQVENALPQPPGTAIEMDVVLPERGWDEFLEDFTRELLPSVQDESTAISAFERTVKLEVTRGIQRGTRWEMGYGPRIVGAHSSEFAIFEPGAPDSCFELIPEGRGVRFMTSHPRQVLLNGESVSTSVVKDGDKITIMGTLIEVRVSE